MQPKLFLRYLWGFLKDSPFIYLPSIAVLFLLPLPLMADSGRKLISLADYIDYGLQNSAALKGAFESYNAASRKFPQITALPNPKMTYGYFIRPVETRVGAQRHKLGFSQSLPWFGTLSLKGDKANAEAIAEFNRFLFLKNELIFAITKAYAELAYVNAAIDITKETIRLVQSWGNVLQERFRTNSGSHGDLVKVQIEIAKLEDKLIELRDLKAPLQVNLNSLINRKSIKGEFSFPTPIKPGFLSFSPKKNDQKFSFENVLERNPEILMLDAVIQARQKGVKIAEKKFYPSLVLGVDYIFTGDRNVHDGGKDAVLGMVSIDIPIDWERTRSAVDEAKALKKSFQQMRKDKKFQLRSEFSRASYEMRDSKRKISLYKNTLIPKIRESLESNYAAYQAGDASFLDVIDSEKQLIDFRLMLKRVQADYIIGKTKLEKLVNGSVEK